ncbi:MAG: kelch repeat-containing protein [Acidobacteriota bacterium]
MKIGALRGLLVLVPAALAADGSRAAGDTFSMLSPAGTPPSPRIGHSIALDAPDDRAIVFGGGTILLDQLPVFVPTSDLSALSLTPGAESWTALSLPSPPPVRMFHTAVFDPIRDRMLVYGGLGQNYQTRGDLWELTLATGSEAWRLMAPTGSSPSARFAQSAVYVPPLDSMIVYGGYASLFLGPTNDLFVLSLAVGDGDWTQEPAGGGPGSGAHQMAFDPVAQRVLLFGIGDIVGQTSSNDLYARSLPFATTSWVKLQPPAPLPTSRQGFGAAFDASSFPGQPRWLVLSGGILDLATSATGEYAGDGYVLDATPGAERWDALVPSTSISRTAMWPAVHDVAGNRIILFGGRDGQGDQNAVYALGLGTSYAPRLASVSPAGGDAGQSVEVTLQGSGTAWTAGASIASFGPEITVNRVTVLSPTQIVASITIQAGALDGTRNVGVLTGSVGDTAIDAFTVKRRPRNVLVGRASRTRIPTRVSSSTRTAPPRDGGDALCGRTLGPQRGGGRGGRRRLRRGAQRSRTGTDARPAGAGVRARQHGDREDQLLRLRHAEVRVRRGGRRHRRRCLRRDRDRRRRGARVRAARPG